MIFPWNFVFDASSWSWYPQVRAVAVAPDGKLVAGGAFTSAAPNGSTTASTRNNLARFNADGTLDQNFNPNPNSIVNALAALPNGQFIIGGAFTWLQPREANRYRAFLWVFVGFSQRLEPRLAKSQRHGRAAKSPRVYP